MVPSLERSTPNPTAVPSLEPGATAIAGTSPILFSDNFDDPSKSSFREYDSDEYAQKFIDGTYVTTITVPATRIDPLIGDYADAAIEVDVSIEGPNTGIAGLMFRYQDEYNYYRYVVDSEGRYSLIRVLDKSATPLIKPTSSPAIKAAGQSNKLRVVTKGDKIQLYANDKLLDEISDGTFTSGKARLVVDTSDDPNVTAKFDNLIVQEVK